MAAEKEELYRYFRFSPPFDKRHTDPKKNYGIGAATLYFAVIGEKGAISCTFSTNIYTPAVSRELKQKNSDLINKPIEAWSLDGHSRRPSDSKTYMKDCSTLGGECWCDGSGLVAQDEKLAEMLMEKGSDAVYEFLEKAYFEWGWI
jgi:hypothetical protein